MAITPIDISTKEFSKKFKGYHPDEVDDFLDRIVLEMESLIKEKRELEKKIKFMGEQVEHYMSLQDTLNKSIVVAQDAADRLRENAEKEAEMIVSNAQRAADEIATQSADKANRIAEETETLRKTAVVFRKKFQILVESQLDLIRNEEWSHLLEQVEPIATPTVDEVLGKKEDDTLSVDMSDLMS
ncbi:MULTISPECIES: DivIVA domain-containing protein [unclassified Granulicatella]|uniref:DivIVA domain-containing protein n=1 Tax=unclassified Granulicatella TaxID=2630493 RepID=UPI001073000D|nr:MULTISPECIES: DivIVA domain-containing protein [unclassified Granulicatella]MBF0780413.1 DivIVA domain-containing protein [Granulicatella sp. 19428wC4_WM01]TFU95450.1 DivIVA domain-containing protein [Granulicatella sp. WM01]